MHLVKVFTEGACMNTEKKLFIADLKHNQAKRSLSSVTDTFSNTITIERDQAQVPTANHIPGRAQDRTYN